MCLCGKIKNLILCVWRFALTPFRSVVVFISDFFAPFFRKTVNFLFFVSLDKCVTQKRKHACDKKTVNKDTIENQVVKAVMNKIMDDELSYISFSNVIAKICANILSGNTISFILFCFVNSQTA